LTGLLDRGLTIHPGNTVFVRNEWQDDWTALVEDILKADAQVLLDVTWLRRSFSKKHCPRVLFTTELQDTICVETVNDVVLAPDHSTTCLQSNVWCWGPKARKRSPLQQTCRVCASLSRVLRKGGDGSHETPPRTIPLDKARGIRSPRAEGGNISTISCGGDSAETQRRGTVHAALVKLMCDFVSSRRMVEM
jgi:hypothetical protein